MEQRRLAVCPAFGVPTRSIFESFPIGIQAIPEISRVGKTEEQWTAAGIPHEAGVAQCARHRHGREGVDPHRAGGRATIDQKAVYAGNASAYDPFRL